MNTMLRYVKSRARREVAELFEALGQPVEAGDSLAYRQLSKRSRRASSSVPKSEPQASYSESEYPSFSADPSVPATSCIVFSGEDVEEADLHIKVDREMFAVKNGEEGLAAVLSAYWLFNIQYDRKLFNTLLVLERLFLGLTLIVYPWCLLVTAGQSHGLSFQAAAPPATCLHVPRREVLQGSSVSVPCAGADHGNGGQIRWYKEGKPVLPVQQGPLAMNGSSLRLTQLGSADSGCYQCLRDNGRWSSYALEVIAFPSARIRWQLQDQWGPASSAAAGTTVLLSGTGSLLRVEALDRRHHGMKLRCTASRPVAGAASAAVTLDIYRKGDLIPFPTVLLFEYLEDTPIKRPLRRLTLGCERE
ncbi:hypothetical protein HPB49_018700 [Dermacentor silvarum]|uniref:Uncharacterized protein n=1 Tax=Dermacentor silvarum TaxID=543639 RepID=A0ACB8DR90_DERSI|nr:hypothetical protein HPB49_018700 [Dermacentor silvarum]